MFFIFNDLVFPFLEMDPTESILSTFDSLARSDSSYKPKPTFNFGFDDIGFNEFDDYLINSDSFFSPFFNDQIFNTFDQFEEQGNLSSTINSKCCKTPKISISNKNSNSNVSLLKNSNEKTLVRPKISKVPKVYISKSKNAKGTSILVKKKKSLLASKNSLINNNHPTKELKFNEFNDLLKDHDYCIRVHTENGEFHSEDVKLNDNNELQDVLDGYCTDDVVLKELPQCLSNLIDFSGMNSEDLLNGLNNGNHLLMILIMIMIFINLLG